MLNRHFVWKYWISYILVIIFMFLTSFGRFLFMHWLHRIVYLSKGDSLRSTGKCHVWRHRNTSIIHFFFMISFPFFILPFKTYFYDITHDTFQRFIRSRVENNMDSRIYGGINLIFLVSHTSGLIPSLWGLHSKHY